ncbi:phosphoadenylyl-sulfate reductase [Puniceicoccus vermicola]|uniref:Phosphoadenosine 5'-phosphosulfate reductase n=1 Tax=Puniceicoccus vermicola TaxID=388746 RepID=A0A7X1E2Q5_9BACT|nr:phosphoadenylyl-sulfate reductase [Puniceicoccus vermicola]MBC2600710.1 phosphoadenylyl-sulfate reductase [Puniceicoccus vermicola]
MKDSFTIDDTNRSFAEIPAEERVDWAVEQFSGELVLSTSFGIQSAVLLHMVGTRKPKIPVIFVDTGYLFPETYRFADRLTRDLDLDLRVYNPRMTAARQEALYGKRWEGSLDDLGDYNRDNKVEPMNRALGELGARAWISGLRRSQGSSRSEREFIELQNKTYKIYPILDWSNREIYQYLTKHDLPYHPLWEQGYVSMGDWHSTQKLTEGMTEEETRFGGRKRECGLHELTGGQDFQI